MTIWRELKRMGVLYLQQCVCILPNREALQEELMQITTKIVALGGEFTRFDVPTMPTGESEKIVTAFRALRDKEYAEIVEECETKFVKEIEFEHFRQNYTFEEVEEIGQDLEKINRWYQRVAARDWFGAAGSTTVEQWIAHCQELLNEFEQTVYRHNGDDHHQELLPTEPRNVPPLPPGQAQTMEEP